MCVCVCVFKLFILDDPFKKIDADGLFVVPGEDAFAETLDHAGLADGAVAHNHHLLLLHLKERKNTFFKKRTKIYLQVDAGRSIVYDSFTL